jgi:hypothetical protein
MSFVPNVASIEMAPLQPYDSMDSHCRNPSFGLVTKAKGLQGCGPIVRKPGSQGKGIARVRAKSKPGSHITYSQECKKV